MTPMHCTARCATAPGFLGRVLCIGALAVMAGCGSLGSGRVARKNTPLNAADALGMVPAGPSDVEGPTERRLKADRWNRERQLKNDPRMAKAMAEYDAAMKLHDSGQYKDAEKSFHKIVKSRRATYESFGDRFRGAFGFKEDVDLESVTGYGDPVEEDAMFMVAECQYRQRSYAGAEDSYTELLEKYPSTRHMEDSTQRLLGIAMYWLGYSAESDLNGDIKLAGGASINPAKPPKAPSTPRIPIIPNVSDRTRPVFDTDGRALGALRKVWLHDAAGNLADDALMVSANHHLRTGDFVESARLYKLLREQYPDSPHFQDAHLLGAHVTMASYEGSAYDGKPLDEASNLKKVALASFTDMSDEERQRLHKEISRMDEERVGRLWATVEFYQAKRQPESIEVYCLKIINQFPESKYAEMARKMLASLEPHKKPEHRQQPPQAPPASVKVAEAPPKSLQEPTEAAQVDLDQ
ncbi:Outer membrane protein assembly factor BamD [Caulifigura coniformis]|uniref:Outer membrane protein assembly factor BamD n=1 Tax=Caulifigura coniformis TaxID=2527983 RepID=A0A517SMC2_9PLAN|nr:tetratricopeptide repeat protein [Caulifigura coniformis]QDT57246.1 Outer membrane protein assembly factor BamD [Caulifigura coniformis]